MLSDNGGEFRSRDFRSTLERLGVRQSFIHAGRPQTNGAVESLHRTILDECWRPAFRPLSARPFHRPQALVDTYLDYYNTIASTTAG